MKRPPFEKSKTSVFLAELLKSFLPRNAPGYEQCKVPTGSLGLAPATAVVLCCPLRVMYKLVQITNNPIFLILMLLFDVENKVNLYIAHRCFIFHLHSWSWVLNPLVIIQKACKRRSAA